MVHGISQTILSNLGQCLYRQIVLMEGRGKGGREGEKEREGGLHRRALTCKTRKKALSRAASKNCQGIDKRLLCS